MRRIHNGTALAVLAALAVGVSADAGPPETVVVTGSRAVAEKNIGRTTLGVPIKEVSLTYRVNIADLDSHTAAGRAEIEKRVTAAAKAACDEIDRLALGGPTSPDDAVCVKLAVEAAMKSVN